MDEDRGRQRTGSSAGGGSCPRSDRPDRSLSTSDRIAPTSDRTGSPATSARTGSPAGAGSCIGSDHDARCPSAWDLNVKTLTRSMVRHAHAIAREVGARAILLHADVVEEDCDLAALIEDVNFRVVLVSRREGFT